MGTIITSKNLVHLGLVVGIKDQSGIIEAIYDYGCVCMDNTKFILMMNQY